MNCIVCKNENVKEFVKKDSFFFLKCSECGYVFMDPMPDYSESHKFYNDNDALNSMGIQTAKGKFKYTHAPSRKRRAIAKIFRLGKYVFKKNAIDIGCGGGFMVNAFRLWGAKSTTGIDISSTAIEYASSQFSKCLFINEDILRWDNQSRKFDFIYCSEILEHVYDLKKFMNVLKEISADSSFLYITTPDISHSSVPANIIDWPTLSPPEHVRFFNKKNIILFFEQNNFTCQKVFKDTGLNIIFKKK